MLPFLSNIFNYRKNKHDFWDIQPVSRIQHNFSDELNKKTGLIQKPKYVYTNIDLSFNKKLKWGIITNINAFHNFLKQNYIKNELYSIKYLEWILKYPYKQIIKLKNREQSNICLLEQINKNGSIKYKIKGTIIGKPCIYMIHNKIVEMFYVDYLCIEESLRNQRLAPKIIYKIIDVWKNNRLDAMIFYIDYKPLPFDYIKEIQYKFIYLDKKINYNQDNYDNLIYINDTNIDEYQLYKYFMNYYQKNHTIYQIFTYEEFIYNFISNDFIDTYITLDPNNNIKSFINIHKKIYKIDENIINGIELKYFISRFNDNYILYQLFDIYKNSNDVFVFTNENELMLNNVNIHDGHKSYLHLYNYKICQSHE